MSDIEQEQAIDPMQLAAEIVSAYISKNSLPAAELPALIRNTYTALVGLSNTTAVAPAETVAVEKLTPAQIRKSITPDALISFVDGKPYKTLKRHLGIHGLTPPTYRERYGLPNDYPMVAAGYAKMRSELAKSIGLGRPGGMAAAAAEEPKPRGRRKAS